jgi:hypothetical protein
VHTYRTQKKETDEELETYVHTVFLNGVPIAKDILSDIKKKTASDSILSGVIQLVENGWLNN